MANCKWQIKPDGARHQETFDELGINMDGQDWQD
jgi:hypothetical protein